MAGIAYFVTGSGGTARLATAGLADRFERPPVVTMLSAASSPSGTDGVAFSDGDLGSSSYEWHAAPGDPPAYWFGWPSGERPRPDELRRSVSLGRCARCVCGDGNEWLVPIVVSDGEIGLPREPQLNPDGTIVMAPRARYSHLIAAAHDLWPYHLEWPRHAARFVPFAADVLAVAYRIGMPELVALGVLDEDSLAAIVVAAYDVPSRVGGAAS